MKWTKKIIYTLQTAPAIHSNYQKRSQNKQKIAFTALVMQRNIVINTAKSRP
jgi:hypothetical protein